MKKQERVSFAQTLAYNNEEKLASYIGKARKHTKPARVIKVAIDEVIADLHGDLLIDQDIEGAEKIMTCVKEIKAEMMTRVIWSATDMTTKENEITKFKVMIEDHTNNSSDDASKCYEGDILTYFDTLGIELFNCASGSNYITPAVIFDTESASNAYIKLMNAKFDLVLEKVIGYNEGMLLRYFTHKKK